MHYACDVTQEQYFSRCSFSAEAIPLQDMSRSTDMHMNY